MRVAGFALALIAACLAALTASAFEIEEEQNFPQDAASPQLVILSTTDANIFAPVIEGFRTRNPQVSIRYVVASSQEVFKAVQDPGNRFDLVISSAMDLQMKLANDGYAAAHEPPVNAAIPDWANWRNLLFGFSEEPVVVAVSKAGLAGLAPPRTRRDLVELLRDNPGIFNGKIGTYDPEISGAGYLFATQDSRQSDAFWRLAEVMGRLNTRLYCCSGDMIADLKSGRLLLAYNLLGSYAEANLAADGDIAMIEMQDFTIALLRTAFVPANAERPELGGAFLDFLLSPQGRRLIADKAKLPPIEDETMTKRPHLRPIRLDPGLLVYLDQIKRRKFLGEWTAALVQP